MSGVFAKRVWSGRNGNDQEILIKSRMYHSCDRVTQHDTLQLEHTVKHLMYISEEKKKSIIHGKEMACLSIYLLCFQNDQSFTPNRPRKTRSYIENSFFIFKPLLTTQFPRLCCLFLIIPTSHVI